MWSGTVTRSQVSGIRTWRKSGGQGKLECIIPLTSEAGPCSTDHALALLLLETWSLSCLTLTHLFSYSLLFSNAFQFLCPKVTKYLLPKTLQSHCESFSGWCNLVLPLLSLPHPTTTCPLMISAPVSLLVIQHPVYCYDTAVPTLA